MVEDKFIVLNLLTNIDYCQNLFTNIYKFTNLFVYKYSLHTIVSFHKYRLFDWVESSVVKTLSEELNLDQNINL